MKMPQFTDNMDSASAPSSLVSNRADVWAIHLWDSEA